MAGLNPETAERAAALVALYPHRRSALIPICHLAQAQDGWLTPEAMEAIADLLEMSAAEVLGTASFYEMLRTRPVGRHMISVCTNIACLLDGGYELIEHAEERLGVKAGGTTADGEFTLEEAECIADCDRAPCIQVNYRFFGKVTHQDFDTLLEDLRSGKLADEVPAHGVLSRVSRRRGLEVAPERVTRERAASDRARAERAARSQSASAGP